MSKRITITIDDDISDVKALECVLTAVKEGRISKNSKGDKFYCWGILFPDINGDLSSEGITLWTSSRSKEPNASFRITRQSEPCNSDMLIEVINPNE